MSRHEFQHDPVRVAIGWDAPLATFYLQVWTGREADEDDGPAIWLGTAYGEAPDPEPLIAIARQHLASMPTTIGRQLRVDQLMAPPRHRSP